MVDFLSREFGILYVTILILPLFGLSSVQFSADPGMIGISMIFILILVCGSWKFRGS